MTTCQLFEAMHVLGQKWTFSLLQEIDLSGDKGFNFLLQRMQKISPKVLSQRLQSLESQDLISKDIIHKTKVINTSYTLTDKGQEFYAILTKFREWNSAYGHPQCAQNVCTACKHY